MGLPRTHPQYHAGKCKAPSTDWFVTKYKHNRSAFNGYAYTPSAYSEVQCRGCRHSWRTKASYVEMLKHGELK